MAAPGNRDPSIGTPRDPRSQTARERRAAARESAGPAAGPHRRHIDKSCPAAPQNRPATSRPNRAPSEYPEQPYRYRQRAAPRIGVWEPKRENWSNNSSVFYQQGDRESGEKVRRRDL